jgi:hypothetical protein
LITNISYTNNNSYQNNDTFIDYINVDFDEEFSEKSSYLLKEGNIIDKNTGMIVKINKNI